MWLLFVGLCIFALPATTGVPVTPTSDSYVIVKARETSSSSSGLNHTTVTGYNTTGFLAVVDNPLHHFHVYSATLKDGGCGGYITPSKGARQHKCQYAVNGGPFVMGKSSTAQTCMGHVVSDGQTTWSDDSHPNFVQFGLTKNGSFVLGVLTDEQITELDFVELVSGFNWLVRDGAVVSTLQPGGEVAPRTTIGVDASGRLILFEADGVEKETPPVGLTMLQTAEWVQSLGLLHAINLDGGGSSVSVLDGHVISRPSCIDIPVVCERRVTTFMCIK